MIRELLLKNGRIVVPENVVVIEESITQDADYAGIVSEKNGLVPTYLFLSEKPISEYSDEDEERIYRMIDKINPQIKKIRQEEVDAVFDASGRLCNGQEWVLSARVLIYPVPECLNEDKLYHGIGIIREG